MSVAGWNTFAQLYNTYSAMRGMPEAFKSVSKVFKGDNKSGIVLLIFFVVLALVSGVLTTMAIVKKYAGTVPLPEPPAGISSRYAR